MEITLDLQQVANTVYALEALKAIDSPGLAPLGRTDRHLIDTLAMDALANLGLIIGQYVSALDLSSRTITMKTAPSANAALVMAGVHEAISAIIMGKPPSEACAGLLKLLRQRPKPGRLTPCWL